MPRYTYVALDAKGRKLRGVIELTLKTTPLASSGRLVTTRKPLAEEGKGGKSAEGCPFSEAACFGQARLRFPAFWNERTSRERR